MYNPTQPNQAKFPTDNVASADCQLISHKFESDWLNYLDTDQDVLSEND